MGFCFKMHYWVWVLLTRAVRWATYCCCFLPFLLLLLSEGAREEGREGASGHGAEVADPGFGLSPDSRLYGHRRCRRRCRRLTHLHLVWSAAPALALFVHLGLVDTRTSLLPLSALPRPPLRLLALHLLLQRQLMLLLVHALIVPVSLVWLLLVLVLDLVEMQVVVLSFVARPSFLFPFLTPLALALALALRGGAVEKILETLLLLRGGTGAKRRSRRAQALDVARARHSLYRRCAKQR